MEKCLRLCLAIRGGDAIVVCGVVAHCPALIIFQCIDRIVGMVSGWFLFPFISSFDRIEIYRWSEE